VSTFRHSAREIDRSADTVRHQTAHPNRSVAHADWAENQTLHLACLYSNPMRWNSRERLFNDFRRYMSGLPNIVLHVVEVAYGDRPFEVTSRDEPTDTQLRTRTDLWHKERALNLAIWNSFPKDWEYGGWIDGDIYWNRYDVGLEAIHQLQRYDWVQLFSSHTDLGPRQEILRSRAGMAYLFHEDMVQLTRDEVPQPEDEYWQVGAPGFGWAFRRESFEACGSLMDACILGSADLHMALGLIGSKHLTLDVRECGEGYKRYIRIWQERANRAIKGNVGYVEAALTHAFHGPRDSRGYNWRWKILRDHGYDPVTDVFPDDEGLWRLTELKPGLRDAIRVYQASRNEDDVRVK
jgi:hypothetical protein